MHHDQIGLLLRLAQELRYRAQNERVTDPVKAILAQPSWLRNFLIDWVRSHIVRDCLMKGGVEERYAPHMSQFLAACADDLEGGEIVSIKVLA